MPMNNIASAGHIPKIMIVIINRDETKRLDEMLAEKNVRNYVMQNGVGTARSEILKTLGLSDTKKTFCACLIPFYTASKLLTAVAERFAFSKPGNGIAFIMPVSALNAIIANKFSAEFNERRERTEIMDNTADEQAVKMEMVFSIINQGYSDELMDTAYRAGASGGTVLHARGTAPVQQEKFHGITIQSEKEIVAIIIAKERRRELMRALSEACGPGTPAHGIMLSVPVEQCEGIRFFKRD